MKEFTLRFRCSKEHNRITTDSNEIITVREDTMKDAINTAKAILKKTWDSVVIDATYPYTVRDIPTKDAYEVAMDKGYDVGIPGADHEIPCPWLDDED